MIASVYVMRNGEPVRVPIQTGSSDGSNTVVVSGLRAGDQVVTAVSSGSARSSSASGSNIFGFGGPGGGSNNRSGAQQQQRTTAPATAPAP